MQFGLGLNHNSIGPESPFTQNTNIPTLLKMTRRPAPLQWR
jgi:hypothetical protein